MLKDSLGCVDKFYAFPLNDVGSRFSVYYISPTEDKLEVLWPVDSHNGKDAVDRPPTMQWSMREKYPRWHFYFNGSGYSRIGELQRDLSQWLGRRIEVLILSGKQPSGGW